MWMLAVVAQGVFWNVLTPVANAAAGCAPSTDAAVLQALGGNAMASTRADGYRVRDVVVDPLLHRAFVHVEQCGHPERPLVLLPFAAGSSIEPAGAPAPDGHGVKNLQGIPEAVAAGSEVAVAMGDAHMQLTVRGRLLQSAAVGSEVDVQLASLQESPSVPGEESKRVHGVLTSAHRVEAQP